MSRQWVDNFAEGCQVLRHWLSPIKPRHERPQRKAFARRVMRLFQVDHHHHRWWAPTTGSYQKLAEAVIAKVKARALVLRASTMFQLFAHSVAVSCSSASSSAAKISSSAFTSHTRTQLSVPPVAINKRLAPSIEEDERVNNRTQIFKYSKSRILRQITNK